jgi:hypothetical protein
MTKRKRSIPVAREGKKVIRVPMMVEVDSRGHYLLTPDQVDYLTKLRESMGYGSAVTNNVKPVKKASLFIYGESPSFVVSHQHATITYALPSKRAGVGAIG